NLGTPAHGTASVITTGPVASKVLYSPPLNYNGADSFTYTANDGTVDSATAATVSITVDAVNDAPVAVNDDAGHTNEDVAKTLDRSEERREGEGDSLHVTNLGTHDNDTYKISA